MANDDVRNVETILDVADMANRLARRMGKEMILNDRWRDQVDRHLEMSHTNRVESR